MALLREVWTTFAHILDPAVWLCAGYLCLRLLIVLARRRRLIGRLSIAGQLLPLSFACVLVLWRLNLHTDWVFVYRVLQTLTTLLLVFVVLHAGDRWLVRRLQAEGRPDAIPRLMRDIGRGVILILTLFIAISQFFNTSIGTILLSSTVFTAIVGFALQDLLKNVFAGIALQIERPFIPGDWIFIDEADTYGRVLEMSWRAIRVRPRDGEVRIIPNSVVAQRQISNMSATQRPIAMRIEVEVDAIHPPHTIHRLMREAVLGVAGVLAQPEPFVFSRAYTAATARYEIKFWIADFDPFPQIHGHATTRMWYVFQRAGVAFASQEIIVGDHTRSNWRSQQLSQQQIAQHLRQIPLLDLLDAQEIFGLAGDVELMLFAAGEVLAHQDAYESQLFAIVYGRVRVQVVQRKDEPALELTTLGPGEVFGERGMLMDEPRSADVVALEDTQTIVIDRSDLLPFFEQHPELPDRLAAILDQRLSATHASLEEYERESGSQHLPRHASHRSLAERIRRALFGFHD